MTSLPRVLVDLPDSLNPLGPAWVGSLRAAGMTALGVIPDEPLRGGWDARFLDLLVRRPGTGSRHVEAHVVRERLGGTPDAVLLWWGLGSLRTRLGHLLDVYPGVPVVLCVDTYPDAARGATEIREWGRALGRVRRLAGLITTSDQMTTSLRRRGLTPMRHVLAVTQPLPLAAHASDDDGGNGADALVFSGRSDCLFSSEWRMRKDAVGATLASLVRAGASVTVRDPGADGPRRELRRAGFTTYEPFSNSEMLSGTFADFLSGFDGQLAIYDTPSAVLRRRVANGLSTRWAFGVAAPAPLLVPPAAAFAVDFLHRHPIGAPLTEPGAALGGLREHATAWRRTWRHEHRSWSAEGLADDLVRFFQDVCR